MGQQVPGGLVAGHAQEHEEHVHLLCAEAVAVDLGVHQRGHDVVARVGQPVGHDPVAVGVDLGGGGLAVGGRGPEVRVLATDQAIAPVEDHVAVLVGHPDHLADHLQGQLGGHLLHELHLVAVGDAVDDGAGLLVDVVHEPADHLRREPGAHQPAVARVLGRVHVEQGHAHQLERGLVVVGQEGGAQLGGERLVVAMARTSS